MFPITICLGLGLFLLSLATVMLTKRIRMIYPLVLGIAMVVILLHHVGDIIGSIKSFPLRWMLLLLLGQIVGAYFVYKVPFEFVGQSQAAKSANQALLSLRSVMSRLLGNDHTGSGNR